MGEEPTIWGQIEPGLEVTAWLRSLPDEHRARVAVSVDRLEREGPSLRFPHTSQLQGKLRELRFWLGSERWRITYFIAPLRRIILLTVFRKTRRQERAEIMRATRAMRDWGG